MRLAIAAALFPSTPTSATLAKFFPPDLGGETEATQSLDDILRVPLKAKGKIKT